MPLFFTAYGDKNVAIIKPASDSQLLERLHKAIEAKAKNAAAIDEALDIVAELNEFLRNAGADHNCYIELDHQPKVLAWHPWDAHYKIWGHFEIRSTAKDFSGDRLTPHKHDIALMHDVLTKIPVLIEYMCSAPLKQLEGTQKAVQGLNTIVFRINNR